MIETQLEDHHLIHFTTIFRTSLQPNLRLVTIGMMKDTLIKHKEAIVIYEESGLVIANYNVLIIQPKSKPVAQFIVTYTIAKQQLTYSNCGKIGHAKETCHNKKREELAALIVPTKVVKLVVEVTAQLVKPTRVPLRYPCYICFSSKHHAHDCPKKTKVHNMFQTKPTTTAIPITKKP
jgi:hypothetical protein